MGRGWKVGWCLLGSANASTYSINMSHFVNVSHWQIQDLIRIALDTVITIRKRSCGKIMSLHLSVILFTGGRCRPLLGRQPPQADIPRTRWPLQRMVRILLECILVLNCLLRPRSLRFTNVLLHPKIILKIKNLHKYVVSFSFSFGQNVFVRCWRQKKFSKLKCTPVVCVPSAAVAVALGGVCLAGGVYLAGGVSACPGGEGAVFLVCPEWR